MLRAEVEREQVFVVDDAERVEGLEDGVAELCATPGQETLGKGVGHV